MSAEIILAFLLGWMLGVWMAWRKILAERRLATRTKSAISSKLYEFLKDVDVITVTVTEEGEEELTFDQVKLDEMLGNRDKKH